MEMYITNNGTVINFTVSETNCHIEDSYKIKEKDIKYEFIRFLLRKYPQFEKRSPKSYYREWKAHNVLYKLNIKRSSTKDTDLNIDESLWKKICYFIISVFSIDF